MKKETMIRIIFLILTILLFGIEVLIALYAHGWVRSYLGDVLVVILIYTFFRTLLLKWPGKWFVLPLSILAFSFLVEILQLWGFCDRFGITNKVLRIVIGTGFSVVDLLSYFLGIIPCGIAEFVLTKVYARK